MPFTIVRQDITKMKVDAIVNAANTELRMGGGVCGAIFSAAGAEELQAACDKAAPIKTGGAAITPGFALPAKYIIHAAGPVYHPLRRGLARKQLRSAYLESLKLAEAYHCESIAFPLISSGIYGYPKAEALEVATNAIRDFLKDHDLNVCLAVFDQSAFQASQKLLGEVESYIDEHYVDNHEFIRSAFQYREERRPGEESNAAPNALPPLGSPHAAKKQDTGIPDDRQSAHLSDEVRQDAFLPDQTEENRQGMARPAASQPPADASAASLEELIGHLDEPFSDTLLKLIDAKGKTDAEVYKKANIDRKLFSKIRSVKGYTPKKPTILALAIALELSLPETDDLLRRAGYALSHASKFDVIVEYFIVSGKYDILDINEILFQYDQPLLGAIG